MIEVSLQKIAALCGGRLHGPDALIHEVTTDTRSTEMRSASAVLFVALNGPRFDGHDFLHGVRERGWCAALVSKESACIPGLSYVLVPNVLLALQALARWWRQQLTHLQVIAVAGSNGKTTTKEMMRCLLSVMAPGAVWATEMTRNNHIGVPLTVLGLCQHHRYAVIEAGMNHPGEMQPLVDIIQPQYALVTNTLREHMGYLKTKSAIAEENGAAYRVLPQQGVAMINACDEFYATYQKDALHCRRFSYAYEPGLSADFEAVLRTYGEGYRIEHRGAHWDIPYPGRHFAQNAVAALALGRVLGMTDDQMREGLAQFAPLPGRQKRHVGRGGVHLIDDGYNANPDSVEEAIRVLAWSRLPVRILVLGDMCEMGEFSEVFHREVGERAREAGIEHIFAYGRYMAYTVAAFGEGGVFFDTQEALMAHLDAFCRSDTIMLLKGSVVMHMHRVLTYLLGEGAAHDTTFDGH